MIFGDLQEFLRYLEQHGQLKRVHAEVDPELEVTEMLPAPDDLLWEEKNSEGFSPQAGRRSFELRTQIIPR